MMACAVFHNIACLIDRKPTEEYSYNEEDSFQDSLDQEDAPNVGAINRVNSLLNYFRPKI